MFHTAYMMNKFHYNMQKNDGIKQNYNFLRENQAKINL